LKDFEIVGSTTFTTSSNFLHSGGASQGAEGAEGRSSLASGLSNNGEKFGLKSGVARVGFGGHCFISFFFFSFLSQLRGEGGSFGQGTSEAGEGGGSCKSEVLNMKFQPFVVSQERKEKTSDDCPG